MPFFVGVDRLRGYGSDAEWLESAIVKVFGCRPFIDLLTIAVRRDRAGVRKPPRKETASRKGIAAAATYGDLRVAGVCCRAVGMTIKDDFEG